jgi:hypothetical protein
MGKLEDQLRGRMERVMAPDGDVEWVSAQGRDAWLLKHSAMIELRDFVPTVSASAPPMLAHVPPVSEPEPPTWLGERLAAAGIAPELVQLCERVLVREEGFGSEKRLARTPSGEFDRAYLTSVGISGRGLQMELLDLHRELRETGKPAVPHPLSKEASARFTEEDRQLLQKLKAQQRAPGPSTTYTVDRGNQMQYTASAFSQQSPQGAQQDQQQLARRIAELEARLQTSLADITAEVALQFEDVHGRVDQLTPPPGTASSSSCSSKSSMRSKY